MRKLCINCAKEIQGVRVKYCSDVCQRAKNLHTQMGVIAQQLTKLEIQFMKTIYKGELAMEAMEKHKEWLIVKELI